MSLVNNIIKTLQILEQPSALKALLSWKYFSLASFQINAALAKYQPTFNTIFDIGANQGQFALAAAHRFPRARIYSFEPVPDVFEKLENNVKGKKQIQIYNCAIGNTNGKSAFYHNKYTQISSVLPIHENNSHPIYEDNQVTPIEVGISSLDDMIAQFDIKPPVLLKMDVQGYEKEVLLGAQKFIKMVEYILFESSFVHLYNNQPLFAEMDMILKDFGYELVAPLGFQEGKDLAIIEMDVLYKRCKTQ